MPGWRPGGPGGQACFVGAAGVRGRPIRKGAATGGAMGVLVVGRGEGGTVLNITVIMRNQPTLHHPAVQALP